MAWGSPSRRRSPDSTVSGMERLPSVTSWSVSASVVRAASGWSAVPRRTRTEPEVLARRAAVIAAVRAAHPGLSHARLIRLDDGTFTDAWRWDTAEQMQAALAAMPIPEARAAMSLTRDATAQDGEIVDER